MNKYYKFRDIYFKLDDEQTFFEHVTNTNVEKVIIRSTHLGNIQKLHQGKTGPEWSEITEVEFNQIKAATLAAINV